MKVDKAVCHVVSTHRRLHFMSILIRLDRVSAATRRRMPVVSIEDGLSLFETHPTVRRSSVLRTITVEG